MAPEPGSARPRSTRRRALALVRVGAGMSARSFGFRRVRPRGDRRRLWPSSRSPRSERSPSARRAASTLLRRAPIGARSASPRPRASAAARAALGAAERPVVLSGRRSSSRSRREATHPIGQAALLRGVPPSPRRAAGALTEFPSCPRPPELVGERPPGPVEIAFARRSSSRRVYVVERGWRLPATASASCPCSSARAISSACSRPSEPSCGPTRTAWRRAAADRPPDGRRRRAAALVLQALPRCGPCSWTARPARCGRRARRAGRPLGGG